MRAALIRVAVDQAYGAWNGPVDPGTGEFVYVAIPEPERFARGMRTGYGLVKGALEGFARGRVCEGREGVALPTGLARRAMHLDPDFERLTYGDNGLRRGKGIASFERDDVIAFYAGLRPCRRCEHRLVYAIIGVYRVAEVVRVADVERARWAENAHTRRLVQRPTDVIVRAQPEVSGRLARCIPIGEWRSGAYRVREELLAAWGGLSCRDGYIQRSAVPPMLRDGARFAAWLAAQGPVLMRANNPAAG